MRASPPVLLLFAMLGCGSGTQPSNPSVTPAAVRTLDAATVKKAMTPDQLALGDPIANSIGMVLVPIPAGEFQMGSPDSYSDAADSDAADREKPQHLVKITKPFYLSVNEVTQQQYEKVMGTRPWEGNRFVRDGPDYPATYVSHDAAVEFCRKLSEQEGVEYRLPTEAQWEYACRAETSTPYSYGDDASKLEQYTWYYTNASSIGESYAHRVGQKPPNPWGLFDMHGNVWEWCGDWYGDYDGATVDDPRRPSPSCLAALANGSSYIGRLGETLFRANREQFMANNHSETERRLWDAADEFRANSDLKSSGAKGGMGVHDPVIGTLGIIGN